MILQKVKVLLAWLHRERKIISGIYGLATIQGLLYLTIPLLIQGVVTYTMAGKSSASLVLLCTATVVVALLIGLLQLYQERNNESLQEKIFCSLTTNMSKIEQSKLYVKEKLFYFFEIVTLQKGVSKLLLDFSFSLISILFGLILLPIYSVWFLVFSVMLSVVFCSVILYLGSKAQTANFEVSNQKYNLFNLLFKDQKGTFNQELRHFVALRKSYYDIFERQYKGILFFKIVFIALLLFLGAFLVQIGELNIGQFVASEIIVFLVINSVEKLVLSIGTCYDLVTSVNKLESVLATDTYNHSLQNDLVKLDPLVANAIFEAPNKKRIKRVILICFFLALGFAVAPWTQTVQMTGRVAAIDPQNKPQMINSRIAGRIEKWYVRDGDFVKQNDTIAFISEIKEEYLDTSLVSRSQNQVNAKESSIESYESKINALDQQIDALNQALLIKSEQIKNKIKQSRFKLSSDSNELVANINQLQVAESQLKRYEDLLNKGLISKTDYENRKIKLQDALAKKLNAENKINTAKNDLLNAELDLNATYQDYNEKLMKVKSEKFTTISLLFESEGSLTKLQNQLSNYSQRSGFYYILAPQDGYIHQMKISGLGGVLKEGETICELVPFVSEQSVELYVDPIDLPLIQKGQTVQLIFDGWPAFVFSGWPGLSYGTFQAKVVAYDRVISKNGKFRLLAKQTGNKWPEQIQNGCGSEGIALLNNVPLIYELWRKINGFPPDFYTPTKQDNEK